jgi:glycosyltransferase involved in cell wall biosynthesis
MGPDVTTMNTLAVLRALRVLPGGPQRANAARRSGLPRVLQLIETGGPGGAERMLLSLSGHLRTAYDFEVGLLKSGWLEAQAATAGLACAAIRAHGAGDLGIVAQLLDVVRRHSISLMHAHEFYMTLVGAVASRLAGIPLVVTVHGKNYYPDKRRRRLIYRVAAMQASRVATVSQDLAEFFCRTTGTPASRVEVVYNGIDVESLAGVPRDWNLLASVGIPSGARVVGAVGNLYPVKGHTYLLHAMSTVIAALPTVHLVVLGRGSLDNVLSAEAEALGLGDHVHFLGHREDVPRWVAAMDVFVLPSVSEGLPLSLLEAMAAARPAVVTAVGGVPEVVRNGETGFVVPPASSPALARAILTLLSDSALSATMGAAGQVTIRQRFSVEQMARGYQGIYRTALERGQHPLRGVPVGIGAVEE